MWEPGAAVGLINRLTNCYLHFFFSSYIDGNNIWLLKEVRTTSCYWGVYCFHIIILIYILICRGVQKVSLSQGCESNFHTTDRSLNARNKKCKVRPMCVPCFVPHPGLVLLLAGGGSRLQKVWSALWGAGASLLASVDESWKLCEPDSHTNHACSSSDSWNELE